jgi:hypothetical protein
VAKYYENTEGVHLHGTRSDYTLCGLALDLPEDICGYEGGTFKPTSKRTVTCPDCADIVKLCRHIKVSN